MCHISHNKYKKDKNAGRNETGYSEETINKYNNYIIHSSFEQIFATNEQTILLYKAKFNEINL